MMEVAYEWANGAKFSEICKLTEIYEGTIIRCMRRLDELIKQMVDCSNAIGNYALKDKFEKASILIKRGIVFAASLYLNA
jgi:ATP-dependent RNA helicase DOB1